MNKHVPNSVDFRNANQNTNHNEKERTPIYMKHPPQPHQNTISSKNIFASSYNRPSIGERTR